VKKITPLLLLVILILSGFLFFKYSEKQNVVIKPEVVVEQVKQESPATVTLMFVGDIMLSRGVEYVAPRYKDPLFPFQNISTITQSADLTIGNLETPITKNGPYMVPYSLIFNSNPKYVERLRKAGFDILSSANNHAMDKGESGLLETMNYVKGAGIDSLGAGEDCHQGIVREVKGVKFGFLSYSYTGYNSGGNAPTEMVCDWKARSNEFGTSLQDWIENSAADKYGYTVDSEVYRRILYYTDILCDKPFKQVT
jgi:poly-gamma-glutamate capsule biosynthesis protein CapA/YwtB (metallophosphatase superfamily)